MKLSQVTKGISYTLVKQKWILSQFLSTRASSRQSNLALRVQTPHISGIAQRMKRNFWQKSGNEEDDEDKVLQKSFDGLLGRALFFFNMDNDTKTEFMQGYVADPSPLLQKQIVIDEESAKEVFIDLWNPLLKKYNFDPTDFITGTKEAIANIRCALPFTLNYIHISGEFLENENAKYLRDICTETCFEKISTRAKQLSVAKPEPIFIEIKSCEVDKIGLYCIETRYVTKFEKENTEDKEVYKLGSIVASVTVEYHIKENAIYSLKDTKTNVQYETSGLITLEGCISGQTELEWRIAKLASFPLNIPVKANN